MAMNYTTYVQSMQTMLVIPTDNTDVNFQNVIPRMIEYAELRSYRDLDFLTTNSASNTTLTANSRNVTMPGSIIMLEAVNVITPSSQSNPELGTRVPLQRVSIDFMNAYWPAAATTGTPKYFALLTDTSVRVAPTPAAAYTAEFIGVVRPAALSPSNATTYLTANLPDLFLAASMIFGLGYQRDFGGQADDPKAAQSWENQYQILKQGAKEEAFRQKSQDPNWTPYSPVTIANTPRDTNAA